MKIDIQKAIGKIVQCETFEEAKILLAELNKLGGKWEDGKRAKDEDNYDYGSSTCYDLMDIGCIMFADRYYYATHKSEHPAEIITFKSLITPAGIDIISQIKNRQLIYVAHPYGGLEENKAKVAKIVENLSTLNPQCTFISPIHAFGFMYDSFTYEDGFKMCTDLLKRCDMLIVCGDKWQESRGCNGEVAKATELEIPILFL